MRFLLILMILGFGVSANAASCGDLFRSDDIVFKYDGWRGDDVDLSDSPAAEYRILTSFNPGYLKKEIKHLTPDLLKRLEAVIDSGIPVLLFSHDFVGGFVSRADERLPKVVAAKLGRPTVRPILVLNRLLEDAGIVAHELVHLRDFENGIDVKIESSLAEILNDVTWASKREFSDLLLHYIIEYRAQNETVFYGQNLDFIYEHYQYHGYVTEAAVMPNEFFFRARELFRALEPSTQKLLRARVNRVIRKWTTYPKDDAHLQRQLL